MSGTNEDIADKEASHGLNVIFTTDVVHIMLKWNDYWSVDFNFPLTTHLLTTA